ncbi:hypothetical protein Ga0080559_TMP892 [Salipiger profundus]|uniref:Uncharacterized protein n=1 Tax=Salipiger profundus TaxID=1229727 RepID=A0A1U7D0P9_9RHOB|nr:hypothetical protein Ga0080559_TMP892 [Salipiger profundus]
MTRYIWIEDVCNRVADDLEVTIYDICHMMAPWAKVRAIFEIAPDTT